MMMNGRQPYGSGPKWLIRVRGWLLVVRRKELLRAVASAAIARAAEGCCRRKVQLHENQPRSPLKAGQNNESYKKKR